MLLFCGILIGALACNEFCSVSCELFNAEPSCYSLCECPVPPIPSPTPPPHLQQAYLEYHQSLIQSSQCISTSLPSCLLLQSYSQVFSCLSENHCKEFAEFNYLTSNIPKDLWQISSPKALISYITDSTELKYYKTFIKCQRDCLHSLVHSQGSVTSFFPYEDCVDGCGERLDKEVDENCLNSCVSICASETGFCMQNCLNKKCGIVEGTRKKKACLGCSHKPSPGLVRDNIIRCPVDDPEFRKAHGLDVDL